MSQQSPVEAPYLSDADRQHAGAALLRFFEARWKQGGEYRAVIESILSEVASSDSLSKAVLAESYAAPSQSNKAARTAGSKKQGASK